MESNFFTRFAVPFIHQENPQQLGLHGVVIFQGFSQGYNMIVPTPIRHQDKSRDLNSTPVLQPEPSSHAIKSLHLPLSPKPGVGREGEGQRNELHCHLRNLRRDDLALVSLLPSAKCVNRVNGKQKSAVYMVPSASQCWG